MPIDPTLKESVAQAVKMSKQPAELANKLNAWLEALAEGNESLTDRTAKAKRLDLLFGATQISRDLSQLEE